MGSILGDMFKTIGGGIDKLSDGEIFDGLGDVLGAPFEAAGRTLDDVLSIFDGNEAESSPALRLLLGEVAVLAKIAKADGRVDKSEIEFMNALFAQWEIDADFRARLQLFFNEQKTNVADFQDWAQIILQAASEMSPDTDDEGLEIRLAVYRHLFMMALADGELADNEIELLKAISGPLGFKPEVFEYVSAELLGGPESLDDGANLEQAYKTLGVSPDASDAEIKRAWKRKLAAFHPDRIQSKDLDPEWVELANQKCAEVNQAYETIMASRQH